MIISGKFAMFNGIDGYSFEELPKGFVFELAMNAYTGAVFGKLGKQATCGEIALAMMREIVYCCDVLETAGVEKHLEELLQGKWGWLVGTKGANIKVMNFGKKGESREGKERFGYGMKKLA